MVVNFRGRLELLHFLDGDDVLEDAGVLFQVRGFGHAAGHHGVCAVGEDDGVDVWGRAQFLAGAGDVGEDAEGVVGFEEGLQFGFGEFEGVFREGVFEGLDCYEGEVAVLACGGVRFCLEQCFVFGIISLAHAVQTPGIFQLVFTPCCG